MGRISISAQFSHLLRIYSSFSRKTAEIAVFSFVADFENPLKRALLSLLSNILDKQSDLYTLSVSKIYKYYTVISFLSLLLPPQWTE